MADSPLLAIIEKFEEERLEFWDDDPMRATAARFLLVAKAYAAAEQLPPRDLLVALQDVQLDDPDRMEAVRQQIPSPGKNDQAHELALACLDADMQVHLFVADARSLSHAGQFFIAAEKYRQAEEARRAVDQRLRPVSDSEREVQHEWHDLAALYPDLAACMEEAYHNHATRAEPLQLAQAAITLAQVGDGAGIERALAIAARWTEGQGPILPILENLAGFLPRWPALQEAILRSPHDPILALDQLTSWMDDPQRQMLSQLVLEPSLAGVVEKTLCAEVQRMVGDEWADESQTDLQTTLALHLTIAIAQENLENLERTCQQIRASMKYQEATTTLKQQLCLLQAWEETRLAALEISLGEIAPFFGDPAVIAGEVVQSLGARIQLHRSILEQINSLAGAVSPATDAHPGETGTTDEAAASAGEREQGVKLPAEAMPGTSQSSGGTGAVIVRNALPGRNGSVPADPLADVYRSLRGERFSEAAGKLRAASNSTTDTKEQSRMARLAVVANACLAALDVGSNPPPQAIEDLIQSVGCLDADSGLDAASTRLDWSNEACPVLDDSGVRMLRREIEVRRAFREVDRFLAQGRFSDAASNFPGAGHEKNGLMADPQSSGFWRDVAIDWSKTAEQKRRLLKPIQALENSKIALTAAFACADVGDLDGALGGLAGPLHEAAALKEPDAHYAFHPLAFWLYRVLTSWRDVQSIDTADRTEQSLLVLQQARLTGGQAEAVTPAVDFGESLVPFDAMVSKLDDEIQNKHRSLSDNVLTQLKTALGQNVSLADLDRFLSSVTACKWENKYQQQIPDALGQMAEEQVRLGDNRLGSVPHTIEQLAGALSFYQAARLLTLFEAKNQSPSVVTSGQSLAEKLAAVATEARQIRTLQADFDRARRDTDGARAKELLITANSASLKLKESGLVEDWDYVIESRRVLHAQDDRLSRLDDWINQLWLPANAVFADRE